MKVGSELESIKMSKSFVRLQERDRGRVVTTLAAWSWESIAVAARPASPHTVTSGCFAPVKAAGFASTFTTGIH